MKTIEGIIKWLENERDTCLSERDKLLGEYNGMPFNEHDTAKIYWHVGRADTCDILLKELRAQK